MPPQPVAPESLAEPRPESGTEVSASVEATQAETAVEAPAPSAGDTVVRPSAPGASGGPQGAPGSQKKAAPERGMYGISDPSVDFLFFSFF